MYHEHYKPTKAEKKQYFKEYFSMLAVAAVILLPFAIYFANMKP